MNELKIAYKAWRKSDEHAMWLLSGNDMFTGFMKWYVEVWKKL